MSIDSRNPVMGYLVLEPLRDAESRQVFAVLRAVTAARGEPILSVFTPAQLARQFHALGFTVIQDCGAENVLARYTAGRSLGWVTASAEVEAQEPPEDRWETMTHSWGTCLNGGSTVKLPAAEGSQCTSGTEGAPAAE
jgi:hypothetical protein